MSADRDPVALAAGRCGAVQPVRRARWGPTGGVSVCGLEPGHRGPCAALELDRLKSWTPLGPAEADSGQVVLSVSAMAALARMIADRAAAGWREIPRPEWAVDGMAWPRDVAEPGIDPSIGWFRADVHGWPPADPVLRVAQYDRDVVQGLSTGWGRGVAVVVRWWRRT